MEESLSLSIRDIQARVFHGVSGSLEWRWTDGRKSSVGYFVKYEHSVFVFTIHYRWRNSEDIQIPIRLQVTAPRFGGRRWWFTCPLVVRGVPCNRRAGKLHLPPGAKHFGCRQCHQLTYRSSQEAHAAERLPARIDRLQAQLAKLHGLYG